MQLRYIATLAALAAPLTAFSADFEQDVLQFFKTYCLECHSTEISDGGMDLEVIRRPEDFLEYPTALTHVLEVMEFEEMPPERAKQPSTEEYERAYAWLDKELQRQRNAAPNDPGIVVAPRLNSAEYGNAIRDLFGTEAFDASQFLNPEGGAGEGFANVGEAHSMGTTQFESYLTAAQRVLSYARVTPQSGFSWYKAPKGDATSSADVAKDLVAAWTDWHGLELESIAVSHKATLKKQTGMTWGAYAERAWELANASSLGLNWSTVEDAATGKEPRLFNEVLTAYHGLFTNNGKGFLSARRYRDSSAMQHLLNSWQAISPSQAGSDGARRQLFQQFEKDMTAYVEDGRWSRGEGKIEDIPGSGIAFREIVQPWEGGVAVMPVDLKKVTTGEVVITLTDGGDGNADDYAIIKKGEFTMNDGSKKAWQDILPGLVDSRGNTVRWGTESAPNGTKVGPGELSVQAPAQLKFRVPADASRFIVTVEMHPNYKNSSLQPGIDDAPPVVVDGRMLGRRLLGVSVSERAKAVDNDMKVAMGPTVYFADSMRVNERTVFYGVDWLNAQTAEALGIPFPQRRLPGRNSFHLAPATMAQEASKDRQVQRYQIEQQLKELAQPSEPAFERESAGKLMRSVARRAWRRLPAEQEIQGLLKLYDEDRAAGLSFDFAVKTSLKAILVSPDFLYRFQTSRGSTDPYLINDRELAERLAFFIWASLPDDELLQAAAQGKLSDPLVVKQQAARMLNDPRAEALATEFAGYWLHFSGFNSFSGPDAEKYPEFTNSLREAMYDESRLFMMDLIRNNRPINNLIEADYTFANEELAKFYGLKDVPKGPEMQRVSTEGTVRGGVLTMGSLLTKHSAPLRTSPVKRGVWVYEQILGIKLPPPPPVPLLSDDETNEDGMTIAQQLEKHRADPACFACHAKFDALGFAMENFDPIGRWRTKDGAGNPVENSEKLGTGEQIVRIEGLRDYINGRFDEVLYNFARKLTGYALGRSILITDQPLLDEMVAAMKAGGNTPYPALGVLLESQQFRFRRDEQDETVASLR